MTNHEKHFSSSDKATNFFCMEMRGYKPCTFIEIIVGMGLVDCLREKCKENGSEFENNSCCWQCIKQWMESEAKGDLE